MRLPEPIDCWRRFTMDKTSKSNWSSSPSLHLVSLAWYFRGIWNMFLLQKYFIYNIHYKHLFFKHFRSWILESQVKRKMCKIFLEIQFNLSKHFCSLETFTLLWIMKYTISDNNCVLNVIIVQNSFVSENDNIDFIIICAQKFRMKFLLCVLLYLNGS